MKKLLISLVLVASAATAAEPVQYASNVDRDYWSKETPSYWMKKYPNAPQEKVSLCLYQGHLAYEKAGGTQSRGDNGFAVLARGTAWETCMDGK